MTAPRTLKSTLEILTDRGFVPDIVIDVGVATGTPDIYRAYPDAFYYFVEPLRSWAPTIEKHLETMRGKYLPVAAGSENEDGEIVVPADAAPGGANLLHAYDRDGGHTFQPVEVRRLDSIISRSELTGPVLLKTDCQGYDPASLIGATGILDLVDIVITECPTYYPKGKLTTGDTFELM